MQKENKYVYVQHPKATAIGNTIDWDKIFLEYNGNKRLLSDAGFIMRDISLGVHSDNLNFRISKWMDDFYKLRDHATEKQVSVKPMVGEDELVDKFRNSLGVNSIDEDSEVCASIAKQYANQKLAEHCFLSLMSQSSAGFQDTHASQPRPDRITKAGLLIKSSFYNQ